MLQVAETSDTDLNTAANDAPAKGAQRTDEWSECITLIARNEDRAAFTRLFRHFAPLMKAFAHSRIYFVCESRRRVGTGGHAEGLAKSRGLRPVQGRC